MNKATIFGLGLFAAMLPAAGSAAPPLHRATLATQAIASDPARAALLERMKLTPAQMDALAGAMRAAFQSHGSGQFSSRALHDKIQSLMTPDQRSAQAELRAMGPAR